MLNSAHQGYIYQDIIGAYFVAQELANGKGSTRFHFDYKKTSDKVLDKFDDLTIYYEGTTSFFQIKYSNDVHQHVLTKQDFSASSSYDLALFDLFETWKALHNPGCKWRICLAWDKPLSEDPIQIVLDPLPDSESCLPGTSCYQFNCDALWPEDGEVLSSWRALKAKSKTLDRTEFKAFLDCLVIEVNCPKSTLLQEYSQGLEKLIARTIERIGIGTYPNDHLTVRQVAESLCTIVKRRRATNDSTPISCDTIAQEITIIQSHGGIEQKFTIDENVLIATPNRVDQVVSVLNRHRSVILTAEPGAGKSWFIENLQNHLQKTTQIVKHYCYIALEDPLALKRITVNVLYGSLITQILENNEDLGHYMTRRYASNLEQLNILLGKIKKKTLLIVDGIDHIWRVYQKNRGGLTEDETKIIQALSQLDFSNSNVSILIVSQPIDQLTELTPFYHFTLAQLTESFVEELLDKHAVPNIEVEEVPLAKVIHEKSNGNALYTKYLIDHAVINKAHTSFEWIAALPPYEFNLTGYYQYLYEQIQGDTRIPFALCGADFSVTETELQEITHLGGLVTTQLGCLKPILRYKPSVGFSIYHESFKRFVIDTINTQGASIEHLIYRPLIAWLETHSFFESTKAYGHLLKLYYEVEVYDAIIKTISVDFLDNSLYNAQPFHRILQNHNLQKAVLQNIEDFVPMIIIAEQMKIIYEIEHNINDQVLIKYLKAVQKIHGEEAMYRVLWDEEHLLVNTKDALRFLANQAYQGKHVVHWSIVPSLSTIPYDILGLIAVRSLHTKQYEKFESLIKNIYDDPKHQDALGGILDEIEWWRLYFGDEWIKNTPYFQSILAKFKPSVSTLEQAIKFVVENDKYHLDDEWKQVFHDIVLLTKKACKDEIDSAISALSQYNWFRNWLIYLIKITDFSQRDYSSEELIDAFSYLVRNLEPFEGKPRACDLYKQIPFIRKSFHQGLLLCSGNEGLLTQCCKLLEKVTNITTSLQRSFSGPLTDEAFLEIITYYLPGKCVIEKYEKYYKPLGSRRYYSDVAEVAFEYSHVLSCAGRDDDAKAKYLEGIQALTAYGVRKDRTFSEVLYCSVPYQQTYGTLKVDWFYDLYRLAMGVVTHTDGKSTNSYPIEWFNEFVKVYPDEALKFLISKTIENNEATWYEEDEFYSILEEHALLFNPTQWFLLCRSLPLSSSNKILANGLAVIDQIEGKLQNAYLRWLKSIPLLVQAEEGTKYSQEIATQFEEQFSISIELKEKNKLTEDSYSNKTSQSSSPFSTTSIDEALAFLETNMLTEDHATNLQQFFVSITNWEKKKEILRQVAKSFRPGSDIGNWVEDLFESGSQEWLYFNVCLFVFVKDGWYHGLHYINYLKRAYKLNPVETIRMLKEILGYSLSGGGYTGNISCNLIKGLSEIQLDETKVQDLLQLTYQIIKRRLPHPPDSKINISVYQGLEGFSRDEIVVALLIARLKTLTTEKTQGIIWSLTFIALSAPKTLLQPYLWAFSNHAFLLPIHRAVLLQILKAFVDKKLIPDELIGQLISTYPTGFFLEDQYIRSFIDYRIELDASSQKSIQLPAHNLDKGFFTYIHPKYGTLADYFGPLKGTYNAYAYQRDKISKEHERYYMRPEQVMTPIVSNANAAYKIVNSQFYRSLKKLTYRHGPSYTCNLGFCLAEIIIQVGSLTRRPSYLLTPKKFPLFEVREASSAIKHEGWITLALKERELCGESFKKKQNCNSSLVLTCGEKPVKGGDFYAKYLFNFNRYVKNNINKSPFEKPICTISIVDSLEKIDLVYLSPFVIKELDLIIDSNIHKGFQARNNDGEVIVKMLSWKEDYYGSVSDGTEVPRIKGVAVMIREDYYDRLLSLYSKDCWFVLSQEVTKT